MLLLVYLQKIILGTHCGLREIERRGIAVLQHKIDPYKAGYYAPGNV